MPKTRIKHLTALVLLAAFGAVPAADAAPSTSFSPPVRVSPPGGPIGEPGSTEYFDPNVASIPGGGAVAVWDRYAPASPGALIQAAFIAADGTPGPTIDVSPTGVRPDVAVGENGVATVAWLDEGAMVAAQVTPAGVQGSVQQLGEQQGGTRPIVELVEGRPTIAWISNGRTVHVATLADDGTLASSETLPDREGLIGSTVEISDGERARVIFTRSSSVQGAAIRPNGKLGKAKQILPVSGKRSRVFDDLAVEGDQLAVIREVRGDGTKPDSLIYADLSSGDVRTIDTIRSQNGFGVGLSSPDIALNRQGASLVWWEHRFERPQQKDVIRAVDVHTRNGELERFKLSGSGFEARAPQVLANANRRVVVWRSSRGVESATYGGSGVTKPAVIEGTQGHSVLGLDLVGLASGQQFALWQDYEVAAGRTIVGAVGRPSP